MKPEFRINTMCVEDRLYSIDLTTKNRIEREPDGMEGDSFSFLNVEVIGDIGTTRIQINGSPEMMALENFSENDLFPLIPKLLMLLRAAKDKKMTHAEFAACVWKKDIYSAMVSVVCSTRTGF